MTVQTVCRLDARLGIWVNVGHRLLSTLGGMDRSQLLGRAMLLSVLSIGISAAVGTTAVVVAMATGAKAS